MFANSDGVSAPSNIGHWWNEVRYDGFLMDWSKNTYLGIALNEKYDDRDGQFMIMGEGVKAQLGERQELVLWRQPN